MNNFFFAATTESHTESNAASFTKDLRQNSFKDVIEEGIFKDLKFDLFEEESAHQL
jgi:hypothetical protein